MRVPATELAKVRGERGLSQREFAALLGMAAPTLSAVENGWRAPWPKLRADAARLLGVSEADLFPNVERRLMALAPDNQATTAA